MEKDLAEKFKPIQFKVLVRPDEAEKYSGKIIIPDIARDRKQIQQDRGTIMGIGGNAFGDWEEPIPKVGDKVLMNRHAGYRFRDVEGENTEYRVINDADISLILKGDIANDD